jgi:hypothetical protein
MVALIHTVAVVPSDHGVFVDIVTLWNVISKTDLLSHTTFLVFAHAFSVSFSKKWPKDHCHRSEVRLVGEDRLTCLVLVALLSRTCDIQTSMRHIRGLATQAVRASARV